MLWMYRCIHHSCITKSCIVPLDKVDFCQLGSPRQITVHWNVLFRNVVGFLVACCSRESFLADDNLLLQSRARFSLTSVWLLPVTHNLDQSFISVACLLIPPIPSHSAVGRSRSINGLRGRSSRRTRARSAAVSINSSKTRALWANQRGGNLGRVRDFSSTRNQVGAAQLFGAAPARLLVGVAWAYTLAWPYRHQPDRSMVENSWRKKRKGTGK